MVNHLTFKHNYIDQFKEIILDQLINALIHPFFDMDHVHNMFMPMKDKRNWANGGTTEQTRNANE